MRKLKAYAPQHSQVAAFSRTELEPKTNHYFYGRRLRREEKKMQVVMKRGDTSEEEKS